MANKVTGLKKGKEIMLGSGVVADAAGIDNPFINALIVAGALNYDAAHPVRIIQESLAQDLRSGKITLKDIVSALNTVNEEAEKRGEKKAIENADIKAGIRIVGRALLDLAKKNL
jgi:hypothetical protein